MPWKWRLWERLSWLWKITRTRSPSVARRVGRGNAAIDTPTDERNGGVELQGHAVGGEFELAHDASVFLLDRTVVEVSQYGNGIEGIVERRRVGGGEGRHGDRASPFFVWLSISIRLPGAGVATYTDGRCCDRPRAGQAPSDELAAAPSRCF